MPNLDNRLNKLEAQTLGHSSQANIVAATELTVKALNAMTEADLRALRDGRFNEISQPAQKAWADTETDYTPEQIALHRQRWQAAAPALIGAMSDSESE